MTGDAISARAAAQIGAPARSRIKPGSRVNGQCWFVRRRVGSARGSSEFVLVDWDETSDVRATRTLR